MDESTKQTRSQSSRWPWWLAFGTALAGVAISIFAWRRVGATEDQRLAQEFRYEAEGVQRATQREISLFMEVLESIQDLHNLSDAISPDDFSEFVDKGMAHQKRILGAFGFAQRIPRADRKLLEENEASPLRIVEAAEHGKFRAAAERDEYSLLTYESPANGLNVPLGFDFGSTPHGHDVLHAMYFSGHIALGDRARSGMYTNSFYVFAPIIYSSAKTSAETSAASLVVVGFAVAILNPADVMTSVMSSLSPRNMQISLLDQAGAELGRTSITSAANKSLEFSGPLAVADQTWTIHSSASSDFVKTRHPGRAEIILMGGLLFTGLLSSELLLMARRNRATEQVVRVRTADLQAAKQTIEKEMQERLRLENEIVEISSREKERVGRDLHDSLGQKLTGAALLSRALVDKLPDTDTDGKDSARKINEIIKETVTQVRRIARGLSPVELGEDGLIDALRLLAEETQQTCGIACTCQAVDDSPIRTGSMALHLYHIAQEAISNAVRHGKARHIAIALDESSMTIDDDGTGIPADATKHGGMGLKLMRYRAAMIGGQLDVSPRSEGGTRLTCNFQTTNQHE